VANKNREEVFYNKNIHCGGLSPFDITVSYGELDGFSSMNTDYSHVHNECEVYIAITGKVSFMVENRIYPVFPGSVVITRPYEYHHCICHTNDTHTHYCIWFPAENNEKLLEIFFNRELGENNLLTLPADKQKAFFSVCNDLMHNSDTEFSKNYNFMRFMHYLNSAETTDIRSNLYPHDVYKTLNYINTKFTEQISIAELAKEAHVSLSSLERHFYDALRMTPSVYLKNKRLSNAAEMLYNGSSVTDACYKSGFSDQSKFITLFKRNYGFTPLQYKKKVIGDRDNAKTSE